MGQVKKFWMWCRRPATKAASAAALAGVIALIALQLSGEGSPDATTATLAALAIALLFGLLAPRQTGAVIARVTRFKVAGIEVGLEAVALAVQVTPPSEEDDGFWIERDSEDLGDIRAKLKARLRFVRVIADLEGAVDDQRDYLGIASAMHAGHLLDDRQLTFVVDLISERDLGLSKVSPAARDEFLDAAWAFAKRFGSMAWDHYVRERLAAAGWVVADFRQRRGHRPEFLAFRRGHWTVMAARVGGVKERWRYGSTAERLGRYDPGVPIDGRCIVIPATPDRRATVVAAKEEELPADAREVRRRVKVLRLQDSLLVNPNRALAGNLCNQDALRPRGRCATDRPSGPEPSPARSSQPGHAR